MAYDVTERKRKSFFGRVFFFLILIVLLVVQSFVLLEIIIPRLKVQKIVAVAIPDWIDEQIIDVDGTSRRGESLEGIKDIVIHYIGNPGTTAQQNRDYFDSDASQVSAHFIVGLDGEIIQCIPLGEKSSASNWRNKNTISIEVCHPSASGEFTEETYNSLVKLTAWLCEICVLNENDVIRHYDITNKKCPLYFVENEDAWEQFKEDIKEYGQ